MQAFVFLLSAAVKRIFVPDVEWRYAVDLPIIIEVEIMNGKTATGTDWKWESKRAAFIVAKQMEQFHRTDHQSIAAVLDAHQCAKMI